MLENEAEAQSREKGQCPDDHDCGNKQNGEKGTCDGESPKRSRRRFLSCEIPGNRKNGDDEKEPTEQHGDRRACVVPEGIRIQASKRRAIVPSSRGVSIKNLRETVWSGIRNARRAELGDDRDGRSEEHTSEL